ncbi:MAG: ribosomal protein S18-alanine N-acetyltransferase [Gemmatimonadota bacterium]
MAEPSETAAAAAAEPSALHGIEFRELRAGDVPQLVAIERGVFATPWDSQAFDAFLGRGPWFSRVALAGREVVGYALGWCAAGEAELMNLAVAPSHRRRALGADLLRWTLGTCAARGARSVSLEVRASNAAAQRLYRRHGFEAVGRRRGYYQNPREDALLFRARLPRN